MWAFRFAVLTVLATLALIFVGGVVHATGSSLACPDWPLCYGQAMPSMQGGIFYEHSHRMIAGLVGILTLILATLLIRRTPSARRIGTLALIAVVAQAALAGRFGVLASRARLGQPFSSIDLVAPALGIGLLTVLVLGVAWRLYRTHGARLGAVGLCMCELVGLQALLGGITVLLRLPTLVSTAHLAIAMIFLALLLGVAFVTRTPPTARYGRPLDRRHLAVGVLLYGQMILGALVRHTGAGLACRDDLMLCAGQWLPHNAAAWLLVAHRSLAWLAAAAVLFEAARMTRTYPPPRGMTFLAGSAVTLVFLQVACGLWTVLSHIDPGIASMHLLLGTLLWAIWVGLLMVRAWGSPRAQQPLPAAASYAGAS